MRVGVTPVPIPNTKVKTDAADNTWLETTWEDRWLPDFKKVLSEIRYKKGFLYGLADKAGAEIDRAYCIQPRSEASWSRQDAYRIKKDIFILHAALFTQTYLENFIQNRKNSFSEMEMSQDIKFHR